MLNYLTENNENNATVIYYKIMSIFCLIVAKLLC